MQSSPSLFVLPEYEHKDLYFEKDHWACISYNSKEGPQDHIKINSLTSDVLALIM